MSARDCCSERDLIATVADRVGVAAGAKKNGGGGAKRQTSGGESGVIVVVGRWEKVGRCGGRVSMITKLSCEVM